MVVTVVPSALSTGWMQGQGKRGNVPHYRCPKEGSKYYLPKYEYKTVVAFCLQYDELKAKAESYKGLRAVQMDGMPHSSTPGDPTAQAAIYGAEAARKVAIIEEAVRTAAPDMYKWILWGVTDEKITYEDLRYTHGMPCGKGLYALKRRQVYYLVAKQI